MTELRFSASEREIVHPFTTHEKFFDDCKIQVSEDEGFLLDRTINLEGPIDCVKLALKFDASRMSDEIKENLSDFELGVFFRDLRGSHNFKKLYSEDLENAKDIELELKELLPDNFNVIPSSIMLVLTNTSKPQNYERVASDMFNFVSPNQAFSFPKRFCDPSEFEQAGFYKASPFAVKWIGEDLDKPLDELVELWLNSEHKHSMEVFYSSTGNFKKQLMALSIYREVLANIISKMIQKLIIMKRMPQPKFYGAWRIFQFQKRI